MKIIRVPPQHRFWTWQLGSVPFWMIVPRHNVPALVHGLSRYLLEDLKEPCENKA